LETLINCKNLSVDSSRNKEAEGLSSNSLTLVEECSQGSNVLALLTCLYMAREYPQAESCRKLSFEGIVCK
jgi:hypothetical protein